MAFVYLNGKLIPEEQASIPLNDRGSLYGDGLVATVRVDYGEPYLLAKHLGRLRTQCADLGIETPIPSEAVLRELIQLQPSSPVQRLRVVVTGGISFPFDLRARTGSSYAFLEPYSHPVPASLKLAVSKDPLTVAHARFKTMANFNRFWIAHEAKSRGFDDGISISPEGYILEASFGNLFWIADDQLYYPDPVLPYYLGITLSTLLESIDLPIIPTILRLEELPRHAVYYRTNTMGGIVPIHQIETRIFATQPWVSRTTALVSRAAD